MRHRKVVAGQDRLLASQKIAEQDGKMLCVILDSVDDAAKAEPLVKAKLTKATVRYLDLHRQNAVRAELLQRPQGALIPRSFATKSK